MFFLFLVSAADIIASHLPGVERPLPDAELNEGRPSHNIPGGKASASTIRKTDETHPRIEGAFSKIFYRADPPKKVEAEEVADAEKPKHEFEVIVCHANVIRYFFCRYVLQSLLVILLTFCHAASNLAVYNRTVPFSCLQKRGYDSVLSTAL